MGKALETTCVCPKVGLGGVPGNHQGMSNTMSQVDANLDMVPMRWICGGGGQSQKRIKGLC